MPAVRCPPPAPKGRQWFRSTRALSPLRGWVTGFVVAAGPLNAVAGGPLIGLGLDDSQRDVPGVAAEEVGELLLETAGLAPGGEDAAVGERRLLGVGTGQGVPAGGFEPGANQL